MIAGDRKHSGIHAQLRKIFQVFGIPRLDPAAILRGILGVANADWHVTFGYGAASGWGPIQLERFESSDSGRQVNPEYGVREDGSHAGHR